MCLLLPGRALDSGSRRRKEGKEGEGASSCRSRRRRGHARAGRANQGKPELEVDCLPSLADNPGVPHWKEGAACVHASSPPSCGESGVSKGANHGSSEDMHKILTEKLGTHVFITHIAVRRYGTHTTEYDKISWRYPISQGFGQQHSRFLMKERTTPRTRPASSPRHGKRLHPRPPSPPALIPFPPRAHDRWNSPSPGPGGHFLSHHRF